MGTKACGEAHWRGDLTALESDFRSLQDEALWPLRCEARKRLVAWVRDRHRHEIAARGASPEQTSQQAQVLNPDNLALGFARRFATYKRALIVTPATRAGRACGTLV